MAVVVYHVADVELEDTRLVPGGLIRASDTDDVVTDPARPDGQVGSIEVPGVDLAEAAAFCAERIRLVGNDFGGYAWPEVPRWHVRVSGAYLPLPAGLGVGESTVRADRRITWAALLRAGLFETQTMTQPSWRGGRPG